MATMKAQDVVRVMVTAILNPDVDAVSLPTDDWPDSDEVAWCAAGLVAAFIQGLAVQNDTTPGEMWQRFCQLHEERGSG